MALSYAYRVLLAGFLPAIAIFLYIEGQDYDPALIRFDQIHSDKAQLTRLLPEKIEGYSLLGNVRLYTRDNLYEYVNGHAEYFISAGFISLAVGEYNATTVSSTEPDVIIDIYDMGKSIQAFGVLSEESGGSLSDMSGGLTGFKSPSGLTFTSGQYYIKLSAYNEQIPFEKIAVRIAGSIGDASDPFPEFSRLPDVGIVAATRFIKESYRGLDFVNNVIEREYTINGNSVHVFMTTKDMEDIHKIATSFIDYFNTSDIKFSKLNRNNNTVYKISDPYEGTWSMIVFPDSIVGIFGDTDETIINKLLKESGS
jgi:hypothetical protein